LNRCYVIFFPVETNAITEIHIWS